MIPDVSHQEKERQKNKNKNSQQLLCHVKPLGAGFT
jgi:hypothetical protein